MLPQQLKDACSVHACVRACCVRILMLAIAAAGLRTGTPTFHSVLLSAVCGPLGLLCHLLTKVGGALSDAWSMCSMAVSQ
jgi:hypothetical protein